MMDPVHPQDRYVDKLPSPPRVIVPPPAPSTNESRSRPLLTQPWSIFEGIPITPDFLRPDWGSWNYDDRHRAQIILPCLFLGSFAAIKSASFLQTEGITMVVAVKYTRPGQGTFTPGAVKIARELGLRTYIADTFGNQDLIAQFPVAIRAMNDHLTAIKAQTGSFGKVLICCSTGNELSAALAVAYLLETTQFRLIPAIQFVQHQRFCISLDDAMKHTLQTYEDIVVARQAVKSDPSAAQTLCNIPTTSSLIGRRGSKRTLDEEDEQAGIDIDAIPPNTVDGLDSARTFAPFAGG